MEDPHTLDTFGIAWRLMATLFFVGINGFFVAAEFSLVKVQAARIDLMAEQGKRTAKRVRHILENLDLYLSACQLGITLASLVLGALGEPAVSVLIVAASRAMDLPIDPASTWLPIISIGIAFALITVLHMTVGEQAPKMWALQRAESTAMWSSGPLRVFTWTFRPFIAAVNRISNGMLRMAGLPRDLSHDSAHTTEEIRSILSLSARAGHISDQERTITENVFHMMELEVRHIVVPRVDIEFLSLADDLETNLARVRESSHSRFPLCETGLDSLVGFVHAKDLMRTALGGEVVDLQAAARDALIVPDTMALSALLRELQTSRQHCAGVVDEHGTVVGLAFLEDALEEIVGPLSDEFDEPAIEELVSLPNGSFELAGGMSLPEVCHRLDFEIDDEAQDTIGGQMTAQLGRMPVVGDSVQVGPYTATVLDASRRRVQRLRMELTPQDSESEIAG